MYKRINLILIYSYFFFCHGARSYNSVSVLHFFLFHTYEYLPRIKVKEKYSRKLVRQKRNHEPSIEQTESISSIQFPVSFFFVFLSRFFWIRFGNTNYQMIFESLLEPRKNNFHSWIHTYSSIIQNKNYKTFVIFMSYNIRKCSSWNEKKNNQNFQSLFTLFLRTPATVE